MKRFLGFTCLLYVGLILYVWISGLLSNFISPNMQIYIKLSIIPLFLMGVLFILNKNIEYKFKISDLVLLLPLIMLVIVGDGNLSLNLATNRMAVSNENRSKSEVVEEVVDYDISKIDYEIIDKNFVDLSSYLTFHENGIKEAGKTIRVSGFSVTSDSNFPKGLMGIGRYYISCCAADATFIGFYFKTDKEIKDNIWYQIEGVLRHGTDNQGYDILYIEVVNLEEVDKGNQYVYACYAYDKGMCDDVKKYNLKY